MNDALPLAELTALVAVALVAGCLLKPLRPEAALLVALAAGCGVFLLCLGLVSPILDLLRQLEAFGALSTLFLSVMLRALGVGICISFCRALCESCGQGALCPPLMLAGKILMLSCGLPILTALPDLLSGLMSEV